MKPDLARGLVAGVAAGLAAALAMDAFQKAWSLAGSNAANSSEKPKPATLKAADKVSQAAAGEPVPKKAQAAAATGVHYLTGAALGALYGVAAEFAPALRVGFGALFGALVWLVLDEGVVPILRLGPKAEEIAPSEHAYALASHLVFGLALEGGRRTASQALDWRPIAGESR